MYNVPQDNYTDWVTEMNSLLTVPTGRWARGRCAAWRTLSVCSEEYYLPPGAQVRQEPPSVHPLAPCCLTDLPLQPATVTKTTVSNTLSSLDHIYSPCNNNSPSNSHTHTQKKNYQQRSSRSRWLYIRSAIIIWTETCSVNSQLSQ